MPSRIHIGPRLVIFCAPSFFKATVLSCFSCLTEYVDSATLEGGGVLLHCLTDWHRVKYFAL